MNQENTNTKQRLIRYVNREQMSWRAVDIERLIEQDHQARAIWEMVGRLDVSRFYEAIASSAEEGGRPAIDPQLLISLWVYAYSRGIGAAREVARRCEYDPAFQWLTGMEAVNDHPLADFRVEKAEELDELFTNLLGVLTRERADHAGRSDAGYRDENQKPGRAAAAVGKTLRGHLERARQQVQALRDRWPSRRRTGISKRRGNRPCKRNKNGWKKRWPNWRSCAR